MLLKSVLVALAVSQPAGTEDLPGAWQIEGSVFFNSVQTICHVRPDNGLLAATCESDGKLGPFTPVTLSNGHIVWSWDSGPAVLTFDARLTSASMMKGEIKVRGFTGGFTATKLSGP